MLRLRRALWAVLALVAAGVAPARAETGESETFLALAAPLLSAAERAAYEALTLPYQRRAFERRFWEVRDPFPETAVNEFATRWQERAPTARERWGSLDDARALAWTAAGEPTATLRVRCPGVLRPAEFWTLPAAGRLRAGTVVAFVASGFSEDTRFAGWSPRSGLFALAAGSATGVPTARVPPAATVPEASLGE